MDFRLTAIADLLKKKQKELDEIEWHDPQDPRIEGLLREIKYYKNKHDQGETYEPDF